MNCSSGLDVRCVETWRRPISYITCAVCSTSDVNCDSRRINEHILFYSILFIQEVLYGIYRHRISTIADHVKTVLDPLSGQYLCFDKIPQCKHNSFILLKNNLLCLTFLFLLRQSRGQKACLCCHNMLGNRINFPQIRIINGIVA